jgi:hypothetical protein
MNETNLNRDDRDLDRSDRNRQLDRSDVRTVPADRQEFSEQERDRAVASSEQGVISPAKEQTETQSFLPEERMSILRKEWEDVQASFVDDPRSAVNKANHLVDQLVDELTTTFTNERTSLEGQWSGGNVDTEALRVALQRYREFFNRLLAR